MKTTSRHPKPPKKKPMPKAKAAPKAGPTQAEAVKAMLLTNLKRGRIVKHMSPFEQTREMLKKVEIPATLRGCARYLSDDGDRVVFVAPMERKTLDAAAKVGIALRDALSRDILGGVVPHEPAHGYVPA